MGKLYDLDDDVLLIILSLISQRDALRLASTCHFGYNIALPRFLSKVDIQYSMRKSHKVAGFCKFMLADAPRRLPYLREFSLADGCPYFPQPFNHSIDPESVALLVQVLRRATEIKKLTIGNEDDLLMNHPELLDALAALPHLQTIRLEYCGWPSLTLLSRSISCPHTLDIFDCNLGGSEGDDDLPIAQNIVTSVRNMKVQLSHLGIDDDLEEDGLEFVPTRLLTRTVWSSVRALNLSECSDMSDIARAFPNLHNLTYSNTDPRPVDHDPLVKWSNLDSVMARCRVPLASRVRRLVLRYTCPPEAEFLTLLQRCTPTILSFNASLVYASYCEGVQGLMTRAVRSNLRYLELYTFWHERNPDQIVQSEIVPGIISYVGMFSQVPLTGIAITYYKPLSLEVDGLMGLAKKIAALIPTLAYVGLDLSERKSSLHPIAFKWYSVTSRAGESPELEQLSEVEGRRIEVELNDIDHI